jgi:hypothetical protein
MSSDPRQFDETKTKAKLWFGLWAVCGFLIALGAGAPVNEAPLWGLGLGGSFCAAILFTPETTYGVVWKLVVLPAFWILWPVVWLLGQIARKPPR